MHPCLGSFLIRMSVLERREQGQHEFFTAGAAKRPALSRIITFVSNWSGGRLKYFTSFFVNDFLGDGFLLNHVKQIKCRLPC